MFLPENNAQIFQAHGYAWFFSYLSLIMMIKNLYVFLKCVFL